MHTFIGVITLLRILRKEMKSENARNKGKKKESIHVVVGMARTSLPVQQLFNLPGILLSGNALMCLDSGHLC
jgi:hypothetical protein